jgi:hypothetical protein
VHPHLLGPHCFVEENQNVRQTGPAEPRGLGHPFFDFLEIMLQNFGSNGGGEVFGELDSSVLFAGARGVSVSNGYLLVIVRIFFFTPSLFAKKKERRGHNPKYLIKRRFKLK